MRQLAPQVKEGSTVATSSFQLQMLKSAEATKNMAVMEQYLQIKYTKKLNSMAQVRKHTILTKQLPFIDEVGANFIRWRVLWEPSMETSHMLRTLITD
jgi:hypothetical protein